MEKENKPLPFLFLWLYAKCLWFAVLLCQRCERCICSYLTGRKRSVNTSNQITCSTKDFREKTELKCEGKDSWRYRELSRTEVGREGRENSRPVWVWHVGSVEEKAASDPEPAWTRNWCSPAGPKQFKRTCVSKFLMSVMAQGNKITLLYMKIDKTWTLFKSQKWPNITIPSQYDDFCFFINYNLNRRLVFLPPT